MKKKRSRSIQSAITRMSKASVIAAVRVGERAKGLLSEGVSIVSFVDRC
jgi:hypothetical protein